MEDSLKHFDKEALQWDKDVEKVKRANIFADEIVKFVHPDNTYMTAIDFGCGTGLLSFALRNSFKSITLIDNSPGMIQILEEKIEKEDLKNFHAICKDPLKENLGLKNFDVVYSSMTIHHMHDLHNIISIFHDNLKVDGYLCIVDLVTEDGTFHSGHAHFDGHKGFDKEVFSSVLEDNGFQIMFYKIVFEIEKEINGTFKKYPLFLLIGKKKANDMFNS